MLPRKYKLSKKKEIENLAKTGRRLTSVFFNLKYKPNNEGRERWLIVASGKVDKKAVVRNKIRRRVREIIRQEFLGKIDHNDIMVIVKDRAKQASFIDLKKDLQAILSKIK